MHHPSNQQLVIPQVINKDFICRQILEISDKARECGNVAVALEGMTIIAVIQGFLDDSEQ